MRARSGNVAADPDNLCGGVVFIAFRSLRGGVTGHATSGEVEFPPPPVVCPFVRSKWRVTQKSLTTRILGNSSGMSLSYRCEPGQLFLTRLLWCCSGKPRLSGQIIAATG